MSETVVQSFVTRYKTHSCSRTRFLSSNILRHHSVRNSMMYLVSVKRAVIHWWKHYFQPVNIRVVGMRKQVGGVYWHYLISNENVYVIFWLTILWSMTVSNWCVSRKVMLNIMIPWLHHFDETFVRKHVLFYCAILIVRPH